MSFASMYIMLSPRGLDAQDLKRLFIQAQSTKAFAIAPQAFDGVNAQRAQHFLYLVAPGAQEVRQALRAYFWVEPGYQVRFLRGDAPGAVARVALLADAAAEGHQRRGADHDGVRAEGDGLDDVGTLANAAAHYDGCLVTDALIPQPVVHSGQCELDGYAHVVPHDAGRRSRAAPEPVDGDDVRAGPYDAAADRGDVVYGGHFDRYGFLVLRRLLQSINKLRKILDGINVMVGGRR